MHDMKVAAGLEEKHPVDQACEEACPKMTMKQRTIGYVATFCIGSLLNMLSWASLVKLAKGEPQDFVTLFVVGNVIQLIGTMFLKGPVRFGKFLISKTMRLATFLYFASMISLIVVCFVKTLGDKDRLGLAILFIIVCYIMMIFFFICSIPFGKKMIDSCIASYCKDFKRVICCKKKETLAGKMGLSGSSSTSNSGGGFSSIMTNKQPEKKGLFGGPPEQVPV